MLFILKFFTLDEKNVNRTKLMDYEMIKTTAAAEDIEQAENNAKFRMGLIFRWYYQHALTAAIHGEDSRVDYQVYCGPAMGAFNQWVCGTPLESWDKRHVEVIAMTLMEETEQYLKNKCTALMRSMDAL